MPDTIEMNKLKSIKTTEETSSIQEFSDEKRQQQLQRRSKPMQPSSTNDTTLSQSERPLLSGKGKNYDAYAHEDTDLFPEGGFEAWTVVLGSCFGLMTVFGIMQTISSIQLYIQSNQLKDVKISSISWVFSVYMFCNLSMGIISGPLFDCYGVKKVLLPGMILNCGGLFACAYSTKLWHFILSFGFAAGIGSGMMLNPLLAVISHWFLKKRGLAMGVSQMGSFTGIVFPIMLRGLYPKLGYTKTMIILANFHFSYCSFVLQ
ncbi:unnamed protein product [Ambrosiozyma monospora]|uniref:Unnamed protein product n=1 Tax=Ambrosiozyma monospora TaxID=43982 RepID=A0ACB5U1M5_AMBMO|nr:unnamed protein product [Ambrosiozyma monospora]